MFYYFRLFKVFSCWFWNCYIDFWILFQLCRYYNNAYYAKVGGISTTEINFLEVDFLFGLGFQLNVNPTTFHTYFSHLQREMLLLQPPLDHHNLNLSPSSSPSSSSSYKSISTKLLHYEDDHQQHQEVAAV